MGMVPKICIVLPYLSLLFASIFIVSVVFIIEGSINLVDPAGPPPSLYDGVKCYIDTYKEGTANGGLVHYNTSTKPEMKYFPTSSGSIVPTLLGAPTRLGNQLANGLELYCQTKVRVVYPKDIFQSETVVTTKKLNNGKQKMYHSGPVPNGFKPMPKNGSTHTMWSVMQIVTHQKKSTMLCPPLQIVSQNTNTYKSLEIQCNIFNASAIQNNYKYINKTQTLLYSGKYAPYTFSTFVNADGVRTFGKCNDGDKYCNDYSCSCVALNTYHRKVEGEVLIYTNEERINWWCRFRLIFGSIMFGVVFGPFICFAGCAFIKKCRAGENNGEGFKMKQGVELQEETETTQDNVLRRHSSV